MEIIKVIDLPVSNGYTYVPIKPVCEVLGIDHSTQIQVLRNHPLLGKTLAS